jgi:Ion channel
LRPALSRSGDRYGLLLILLVLCYLFGAFTTGDFITVFEILLFVGTLLLALRTSHVRPRTARLIIGGTVVGSVIVVVLVVSHAASKDTATGIANVWTGLVLLVTVGVILRRILTMPTVTLQGIFGAISAYMIIGLMFASFYAAMSHLYSSQPFFASGSPANTRTFQYFSFTTLTTLGYGDFTAAQNAGRAVAVIEALGGQIFLATLVARLVASYRSPRGNGGAPAGGSIAGNPAPGTAPPGAAGQDPGTGGAGQAGLNPGAGQGGVNPGTGGIRRDGQGTTGSGRDGQGTTGSGRDGQGTTGSGRDGDGAAGSRPGTSSNGGQAVSRRAGIPRHGGSRSKPSRRVRVKWHGRRRR